MKYLFGISKTLAMRYIDRATEIAKSSLCLRSKCGAIIVSANGDIIGSGFNSPPLDKKLKRCLKENRPPKFKSDPTCCIHAEQRAIMNALKNNPNKLEGATLYFIRANLLGEKLEAGSPYCTICSKMMLDVGIAFVVLWDKKGPRAYTAKEFNKISFEFDGE